MHQNKYFKQRAMNLNNVNTTYYMQNDKELIWRMKDMH